MELWHKLNYTWNFSSKFKVGNKKINLINLLYYAFYKYIEGFNIFLIGNDCLIFLGMVENFFWKIIKIMMNGMHQASSLWNQFQSAKCWIKNDLKYIVMNLLTKINNCINSSITIYSNKEKILWRIVFILWQNIRSKGIFTSKLCELLIHYCKFCI